MAAPLNLDEIVRSLQGTIGQGPLNQLLGGLRAGGNAKEIQELVAKLFPNVPPAASANTVDSGTSSLPLNGNIIDTILEILGFLVPHSPFAPIARRYIGTQVSFTTTAGTVEGELTEVGNWYAVLTEASGSRVVVNFNNTLAFQPETPEVVTI